MRKHFLDNIRWATVLLVVAYHVCYLFNGVGILGGVPGAPSLVVGDVLASVVYPWFMVLLFLVAGVSARYALEKRPEGFLRGRAVKLLVPSTLGLLVVHWVTGYLNIRLGGGLAMMPGFLVYPISVISGIGPLWFAQMLFLFSCVLVLIRKVERDRLWRMGGKASGWIILLMGLMLWGASQVLNLPVLTMYRFGIYFAAFMMGYWVFSHDEVQARVEALRVPTLSAAVVLGVVYTMVNFRKDFTAPACLQSLLTNLYLWAAVLAILGWSKHCFDRETVFTRCMNRMSYGVYVLHYPILLALCVGLTEWFRMPAWANYLIALAAVYPLTFAAAWVVQRVPGVRWVVLGEGKKVA